MTSLTRRQTVAGAAALAAVGTTASAAAHEVQIKGFAFSPAQVSVSEGDTITFTNLDSAPHTATASDGSFDTGRLGRGESAQITAGAAGTFDYFCRFHPRMKGVVQTS